ncbi:MAG: GLUG motif-containing protein [Prevotella sp.]|nr:GLUG motif-containing protein [Prevotella sp.]
MTKMKTKTLFYMALAAVMMTLAACSQDEDMQQDAAPVATPIEFEITDGGYGGAEATRAKEEGYYTRFEATDECGLYIVNGSNLKATNVKLTASMVNGELTWNPENGTAITVADGDKCFLYYPYQKDMTTDKINVNNTDEDYKFFDNLISSWEVKPNQSNHDNYTDSDLMTAKGTATYDGTTLKLSFKLDHRMALAEIVAPVEASFSLGTYCYTPYQAEEWKYRFIVNPKTVDDSKSIKGNIVSKTFTINSAKLKALTPGQYKTFKVGSSYYVESVPGGTPIYHVYDYNGLKAWAEKGSSFSCKLEADITMPTDGENAKNNWTPISNFFDIFDGNGHTITGLVVNYSTGIYAGFIANNHGTVKNLTLKGANVTGTTYVGGVVGYNDGGTIENCHVTGESAIKGRNYAGGVVGCNDGKILACHVAKECSVSGDPVGGIAGENQNGGTVTGCYALCLLTGKDKCTFGGIIGRFSGSGSLTACYSKCRYSDKSFHIGGIVGSASGATPTFTACYYDNCTKGVGLGNGDDPTIKVDGTAGKTWADAMKGMNEALTAAGYTDYQYAVNGNPNSETEPLILVKKQ